MYTRNMYMYVNTTVVYNNALILTVLTVFVPECNACPSCYSYLLMLAAMKFNELFLSIYF